MCIRDSQRGGNADDGAGVLLFLFPLVEEDDHNHGRHDEIDALSAEGQDSAEGRPARPATPAWILPKEYAGFSLSLIHI